MNKQLISALLGTAILAGCLWTLSDSAAGFVTPAATPVAPPGPVKSDSDRLLPGSALWQATPTATPSMPRIHDIDGELIESMIELHPRQLNQVKRELPPVTTDNNLPLGSVIQDTPPQNDDFDQALAITTLPYTDNGSTIDATTAADDPALCAGSGNARGATVWYRLVAPASGVLLVTTQGSSYDTMLAAFGGDRGNLTMLACNDDYGGTVQSRIYLNMDAGTIYYIEVADYYADGVGGNIVLSADYAPPFTSCAEATGIPQVECDALVSLYNSAGGPGWANKGGWLSSIMPCSWYGVACSEGHVTRVGLYDNHLSGSIAAELRNLTNLQGLDLGYNQLSGPIPTELSSLTNLQSLYLDETWS